MTAAERQAEQIASALLKIDSKGSLEHLENADLDLDALEALEHLAAKDPKAAQAMRALKVAARKGGSPTKQVSNFRSQLSAADISIRLTRTLTVGATSLVDGSAQLVDLPAPIFGVLEFESNYSRVLSRNLPQDGSVLVKTVLKTSDGQGIVITFMNVGDTIEETVTIRGEDTIYTNLLRAIGTSFFTIMKPKIILDDATDAAIFGKSISYFYGSMFTKTDNDTINPNKYKTDYLSDNTVRILQIAIGIDPEHALVHFITPTAQVNGAQKAYSMILPIQDFNKPSEYGTGFKKV